MGDCSLIRLANDTTSSESDRTLARELRYPTDNPASTTISPKNATTANMIQNVFFKGTSCQVRIFKLFNDHYKMFFGCSKVIVE